MSETPLNAQHELTDVSDATTASSTSRDSFSETRTNEENVVPPADNAVTVVTQKIVPTAPVGVNDVNPEPRQRVGRNKARKNDVN